MQMIPSFFASISAWSERNWLMLMGIVFLARYLLYHINGLSLAAGLYAIAGAICMSAYKLDRR
jgi:hypothetical protein